MAYAVILDSDNLCSCFLIKFSFKASQMVLFCVLFIFDIKKNKQTCRQLTFKNIQRVPEIINICVS